MVFLSLAHFSSLYSPDMTRLVVTSGQGVLDVALWKNSEKYSSQFDNLIKLSCSTDSKLFKTITARSLGQRKQISFFETFLSETVCDFVFIFCIFSPQGTSNGTLQFLNTPKWSIRVDKPQSEFQFHWALWSGIGQIEITIFSIPVSDSLITTVSWEAPEVL